MELRYHKLQRKGVGWIPIISDDGNKIVGTINFCMNHKQDCIDEFHESIFFNNPAEMLLRSLIAAVRSVTFLPYLPISADLKRR